MNNRLKSGFGFYLILLIVLCLGVYFYYLNSQNTTDEYTVNQFEQDLKAGDVTKIVIKQNEEVPTGVVAASIKGKGTKQFYVSDVTSVVDHVTSDYSDVEVHMTDVDRPSIWVSILPYILMTVVFVFVFFMMTAGAGGGGYLYMIAKDQDAAARIRHILNDNRPNANARFVEMSLSTKGLQVSRS